MVGEWWKRGEREEIEEENLFVEANEKLDFAPGWRTQFTVLSIVGAG
jgi:hypothetical protein